MISNKDIEDYKGDKWAQPSTTRNGMPEIEKDRIFIDASMLKQTRSIENGSAEQQQSAAIQLAMKNSTDSGDSNAVRYAEAARSSTSTTAMPQAKLGTAYAGPATWPLDSLKGQTGPQKQKDTWTGTAGTKYDGDKPPMALLDAEFLEGVARVLGFGSSKYAAHNWRNGISYSRLISAAYRHLGAINKGEDIDEESGLSHSYHLGCCIMFLASMMKNRPELDDRWKG